MPIVVDRMREHVEVDNMCNVNGRSDSVMNPLKIEPDIRNPVIWPVYSEHGFCATLIPRMRWLIVLIFLLFFASSALAGEKVQEWAKFAGGLATGFITHEAGHQAAAWATGTSLSWSVENSELSWFIETGENSGTRLRNVALGGTAAEIISSELILQSNASKGSSYFIGWLTWNILNPLLYVVRDQVSDGFGDLEEIRKNENGLKVEYVIAVNVAHSLLTGYRLWNNEDFKQSRIKFYISSTRDSIMAEVGIAF
jgi:hypothetical protein